MTTSPQYKTYRAREAQTQAADALLAGQFVEAIGQLVIAVDSLVELAQQLTGETGTIQ